MITNTIFYRAIFLVIEFLLRALRDSKSAELYEQKVRKLYWM